jgi:hypothetical protein
MRATAHPAHCGVAASGRALTHTEVRSRPLLGGALH